MFVIVIRAIHSNQEKYMLGLVGPFTTREEGYALLESKDFTKVHENKYSKSWTVNSLLEAYVGDVESPDQVSWL